MRRLKHYVAGQISAAVLLVLLVIVALDGISAYIDEMGDVNERYTALEAAYFVLLTIPGRLFEFIPMSGLIGCLVGLGALANQSELVVMRAAGVSNRRIVWIVMRPVMLMIVFGALLGEYVAPLSEQLGQTRRALLLGQESTLSSRYGVWTREGDEFLRFNAVEPNGVLHGVTALEFDDSRRLQVASYASGAIYQGDGKWLLENVTDASIGSDQVTETRAQTQQWNMGLTPELLKIVVLEPAQLSISKLRSYANYLVEQGIDARQYQLAFWNKVLQPLATFSLVLIAASFVFGPLRQVTMGYRVFAGVIVGIVFRTSQELLGPASLVFGFPPVMASGVPIGLCMLFGVVLLQRAR